MLRGINEALALPLLQPRKLPDTPEVPIDELAYGSICVTGAGGSVGSELVMHIATHQLKANGQLILIDSCELNLYEIAKTLDECAPHLKVHALLADVRDERAMLSIFLKHRPDMVFHAAALKHVPLLENDHNLVEAVRTNVVGTLNVAEAARRCGAGFLLISTDKAVNPSSVMGLTKRAAELSLATLGIRPGHLCIARFGNVLGSSGSVVPLFERQIAQGGPVTVTHEKMTRYMMTIRQAAELVIQAYVQEARRPATDDVGLYVLDMGEPVRIMELAEQMIRHNGLRPGKDIEIKITGIRPGEKLEEELLYPHEVETVRLENGIQSGRLTTIPGTTEQKVTALLGAANSLRDPEKTKECLLALVPEYTGQGEWK